MEQKQIVAVYGWIRENFNNNLFDDSNKIIYAFYRLNWNQTFYHQIDKNLY